MSDAFACACLNVLEFYTKKGQTEINFIFFIISHDLFTIFTYWNNLEFFVEMLVREERPFYNKGLKYLHLDPNVPILIKSLRS